MVDVGNKVRDEAQGAMMLRVWAGADYCQTPLRGGLSIGCGEEDDVFIAGPGIGERHAYVFGQPGSQWTLMASEGQVLFLPDGNETRCLILTPGVCFGIGDAILQCWQEEMAEEPVREAAPVSESNGVGCAWCGADLSRVAAEARYCPRCGQMQTARRGSWYDTTYVDPMDEEMPPPPFDPDQPVRSQMIFGYATAMHNLGVRYEEGRRGTPRNMQEAVRCYIKSARLGNDAALDRLTGR